MKESVERSGQGQLESPITDQGRRPVDYDRRSLNRQFISRSAEMQAPTAGQDQ
jgi:hypothetical protein